MCTYVNAIEEVVTDFVNENKMFTAWDVTMEVRKHSKDRVQHFEVKKEVHRMFDNGSMFSYTRTLANLPNVNPQPWIYHSLSADPSAYTGKPSVTPAPSPTSSMTTVDDDDDVDADDSILYKFDTTDRLCVPNKLIREIGLKTGDEVEVVCTTPTNEVYVIAKGDVLSGGPLSQVATYVVDSYDNVRIGRAAFNKIGFNGVAFEMTRNGNAIEVKKYA